LIIVLSLQKIRNVLLLGSTSGGKTTLKNMLINLKTIEGEYSAFSKTREPFMETFICDINNENLSINIIDTSGLFEKRKNEKTRTADEIQTVIIDCVQREITNINIVLFVFAYSSIIRDQDKDSIKIFLQLYPNLRKSSYIIFTRCEFISIVPEKNNKLHDNFHSWLNSLKVDDIIGEFIENKRILLTGCINQADVQYKSNNKIEICYKNILEHRINILRKIYEVWLPIKIEVVKQKEALENNLPIEINRVESFCDEIFKKEEDQYDIDDYCHYLDIALSFNRILSNPFFYGSKKRKRYFEVKG